MVPPRSDKSVLLRTVSPTSYWWINPLVSPAVTPKHNLQDQGPMQQQLWKSKLCCCMTLFYQLVFLPTPAWGHFSNGAWGQLLRMQEEHLERRYTSAVFPNRHLCLFLFQNGHQQSFARLFITTWICSPLGSPDIIRNGSWSSTVKNKNKPCFLLCWTMAFLPNISGSLCRIIVYKREKHIFYSTLTYF